MEEKKSLTDREIKMLKKVNQKIAYIMMLKENYIPQKEKYFEERTDKENLNELSKCFTYGNNGYNSTTDVIKAIKFIIENNLRLDKYHYAGKITELLANGVNLVEYKDIINGYPTVKLGVLMKLVEAKINGMDIDKYLEAMQKHENAFDEYCIERLFELQKKGFNMDQFLNDNCFVDEELHETHSTYSISGSILRFFSEKKDEISKLSHSGKEILVPDKLLDTAIYATQTTDRAGYGITDYKFKASMYIHNTLKESQNQFEQQSNLWQQAMLKGQIDLTVLQKKIAESIIDGSFKFEFNNQKYSIKQIPSSNLYEVINDSQDNIKYIYNDESKELTDTSKELFKHDDTIDDLGKIARNEDSEIL